MADDTVTQALELIGASRTLTLATAGAGPWAAPVYYVHHAGRFCFFSSANSRHVTDAIAAGCCAASIFRDSDDWRRIEGLQMDGSIEAVAMGPEAVAIFDAYVARFPTVGDFFPDAPPDLDRFLARFRSVLYAFVPGRVFYMNNQAGLGSRQEITLPG